MKTQIRISDAAKEDLKAIWDYLARSNPAAASKLLKELKDKFSMLSQHPNVGKPQPQLLVNLYSFPHKNYLIFYQPTNTGIDVVRVLHGSRDIESLFDDFFDSL